MNLIHLLNWLLAASLIVLIGAIDDAQPLSAKIRLFLQIGVVIILCLMTNANLEGLGQLFGNEKISIEGFGYILTIMAMLGGINAFNMIDGIDGLAAGMSLISLTGLLILFGVQGADYYALICLLLMVSLLPFLMVNLQILPIPKVFLGDAGSTLLGFTIVWLMITGSQNTPNSFTPVTALWLMALPLMDMVAVMLSRWICKISPMESGRDHIHHLLINRGFSSGRTLLIMGIAATILAGYGVISNLFDIPEWISFSGFLLLSIVYIASFWAERIHVRTIGKAPTQHAQPPCSSK